MRLAVWCVLSGGCLPLVGGSTTPSGEGGGLPPQCNEDFGQEQSARAFTAFLGATTTLIDTANDIDRRLRASCRNLGSELGLSEAELAGGTKAVCDQVRERIHSEMAAARASARVTARLETTPPVCTTRVEEYRRCMERCDVRLVQAGHVEFKCEGGELRGSCSGQCSGQCAVQANAQCTGSCEGTCSGSCSGSCFGDCQGQCATRGADGSCAGACQGTCRGSCQGTCSGSCQGRCVVSAQGSCRGECRGGCSVEYQQPVCTGRWAPPEVRTECRDVCDTVQVSRQECTPGQARLVVDAAGAAEAGQRTARVAAAIAHRLPEIQALGERLRALKSAGEAMVRNAGGFADAVGTLGINAIFCSAYAVSELPRAAGQISVAFEVTVSVSASIN